MPTGSASISTPTPGSSSLRSRKLDYKKPLWIYQHDQVSDLDESSALNRTIPQVATGVEKEEEEVFSDSVVADILIDAFY